MNSQSAADDIVSPHYHALRQQLDEHPLYTAIQSLEHLRIFMQHHVYAVWDFMSLIKALQQHLAPVSVPWVPPANIRHANFINQLVLEEESDRALTGSSAASHASHFQSYCEAMAEVGASTGQVMDFTRLASAEGIENAIQSAEVPPAAREFMQFTFDTIATGQPHLLAAVLAFGRESLVPLLFRAILQRLQIKACSAPTLHAYLSRHIELDEQEHGPLANMMVDELCEDSGIKQAEVRNITEQALRVRLEFWNAIHGEIIQSIKCRTSNPANPGFMTRWAS